MMNVSNMQTSKLLSVPIQVFLWLALSTLFASDFEFHLLVGNKIQQVVPTLNTGIYLIDKLPQYTAMSLAHKYIVDYNVGEGYIGKSQYASTAVGSAIMFYATPDDKKVEFIENFIFSCLVPDILFKNAFHGKEDHLYDFNGEQTTFGDKLSILLYIWEVKF